jgi:2',3'-cyclic-nucleotide 2'-phosphodiesterase (5'-nucleotidase family)
MREDMMGKLRWVLALCCLLGLMAVWAAGEDAATVKVVLLHVNDSHGHTQPYLFEGKNVGGYARLKTAVDRIRQENPAGKVFLVHCGDEFSRGDGLTTATFGQANIDLMNQIGFDLWVPGNGDFYNGFSALKKRMAEAGFPTLAANITTKTDGKPIAPSVLVQDFGEVKIGFFGLCFIHRNHPTCWGLEMEDPARTAEKIIPQLRQRADAVVALTHIGLGEDIKLAGAVDGIDIILGAHTHDTLPTGRKIPAPDGRMVLICQAGDHLRYLGRVDLTFGRKNGKWELISSWARLIPLDQSIQLDPAITAKIARLSAATQPSTLPAFSTP